MKLSYFSDKIEGKHGVARERWCPEEMRRRKERWRVDRFEMAGGQVARAREAQTKVAAAWRLFPRTFPHQK